MALQFVCDPAGAGKRLDQFLVERLDGWSRAHVQELVDSGGVTVNGSPARKSHRMFAGQIVIADPSSSERPTGERPQAEPIPLDVIYEDEELLAVNKPAGLVVHPGSGNRTGTMVNALLHHTEELADGFDDDRPGIVHRLDKDTSGVMLVSRSDKAHASLAKQFAERQVHKTYYGFCIGPQPASQGSIDGPIGRSRRDPTKFCVSRHGRESHTDYTVRAWRSGIACVEFRPRTGRTHQIRVHAVSVGMPIVGDHAYGGDRDLIGTLEPLERPFAWKVAKCFERQALHAYRVSFRHPATSREMTLTAPFPADFAHAIACFEGDIDVSQL